MKIQCFYKDQRAVFLGLDKDKHMYKVRTEDGKMHYAMRLEKIDFRDHSIGLNLFETA